MLDQILCFSSPISIYFPERKTTSFEKCSTFFSSDIKKSTYIPVKAPFLLANYAHNLPPPSSLPLPRLSSSESSSLRGDGGREEGGRESQPPP